MNHSGYYVLNRSNPRVLQSLTPLGIRKGASERPRRPAAQMWNRSWVQAVTLRVASSHALQVQRESALLRVLCRHACGAGKPSDSRGNMQGCRYVAQLRACRRRCVTGCLRTALPVAHGTIRKEVRHAMKASRRIREGLAAGMDAGIPAHTAHKVRHQLCPSDAARGVVEMLQGR